MQLAPQAAETASANVNGPLAFVLLLALVLSLPMSVGLIWLYRRAVLKSMRLRATVPLAETQRLSFGTPAQPTNSGTVDASTTNGPTTRDLYAEILRRPRRA